MATDMVQVGALLAKSSHYAAKVQARIDDTNDNLGSFSQYATYAIRPFVEAGIYTMQDAHPAEVARLVMTIAPNPADVDTTEP